MDTGSPPATLRLHFELSKTGNTYKAPRKQTTPADDAGDNAAIKSTSQECHAARRGTARRDHRSSYYFRAAKKGKASEALGLLRR